MPLYEYECSGCRNRFETLQRFSDSPLTQCPTCGGPVHRLISVPALQFKGTGWYVTDYARKSEPKGGDGTSKSSSDSSPTTNSTSQESCKTSSPSNKTDTS